MKEINSVEEIDTEVTSNPNAILVVTQENCPYCKKTLEDLKELEDEGLTKVYTIDYKKARDLLSKLNIKGTPFVLPFKECSPQEPYEGYSPDLKDTLKELYSDALPVCRVELSKVLFEKTLLGEPIL